LLRGSGCFSWLSLQRDLVQLLLVHDTALEKEDLLDDGDASEAEGALLVALHVVHDVCDEHHLCKVDDGRWTLREVVRMDLIEEEDFTEVPTEVWDARGNCVAECLSVSGVVVV